MSEELELSGSNQSTTAPGVVQYERGNQTVIHNSPTFENNPIFNVGQQSFGGSLGGETPPAPAETPSATTQIPVTEAPETPSTPEDPQTVIAHLQEQIRELQAQLEALQNAQSTTPEGEKTQETDPAAAEHALHDALFEARKAHEQGDNANYVNRLAELMVKIDKIARQRGLDEQQHKEFAKSIIAQIYADEAEKGGTNADTEDKAAETGTKDTETTTKDKEKVKVETDDHEWEPEVGDEVWIKNADGTYEKGTIENVYDKDGEIWLKLKKASDGTTQDESAKNVLQWLVDKGDFDIPEDETSPEDDTAPPEINDDEQTRWQKVKNKLKNIWTGVYTGPGNVLLWVWGSKDKFEDDPNLSDEEKKKKRRRRRLGLAAGALILGAGVGFAIWKLTGDHNSAPKSIPDGGHKGGPPDSPPTWGGPDNGGGSLDKTHIESFNEVTGNRYTQTILPNNLELRPVNGVSGHEAIFAVNTGQKIADANSIYQDNGALSDSVREQLHKAGYDTEVIRNPIFDTDGGLGPTGHVNGRWTTVVTRRG